jgi:hypothetical protein
LLQHNVELLFQLKDALAVHLHVTLLRRLLLLLLLVVVRGRCGGKADGADPSARRVCE